MGVPDERQLTWEFQMSADHCRRGIQGKAVSGLNVNGTFCWLSRDRAIHVEVSFVCPTRVKITNQLTTNPSVTW